VTTTDPNGTLSWRVGELERRVERLYNFEPAVVSDRVNEMHTDIGQLRDEIRGVRRALWGFALSITGSAVVFAFTAFQVFGGS